MPLRLQVNQVRLTSILLGEEVCHGAFANAINTIWLGPQATSLDNVGLESGAKCALLARGWLWSYDFFKLANVSFIVFFC